MMQNRFIYQKVIYYVLGEFKLTYLQLKEVGSGKDYSRKYSEIMRQWTIPVVIAIGKYDGAGFNQIRRDIKGINNTSLSSTLSNLEKYGILERIIIPSKPVRVNYSFTEKGRKFYSLCINLASFIEELPEQ
jgi:DNA-binding HxlR family transcriptional regulator